MGFLPLFSIQMDTKDRIRMIMEDQHMNQQVFSDFLQQAPATLSSIFNGRTRPTLNIVDAIKTKIPNISIEWLLYGIGEMYVSHPSDSEAPVMASPAPSVEPMLDFDSPTAQRYQASAPAAAFQQGVRSTHSEYPREELRIVEKDLRKVTEIRVYYDDQTYETFVPAKK